MPQACLRVFGESRNSANVLSFVLLSISKAEKPLSLACGANMDRIHGDALTWLPVASYVTPTLEHLDRAMVDASKHPSLSLFDRQ